MERQAFYCDNCFTEFVIISQNVTLIKCPFCGEDSDMLSPIEESAKTWEEDVDE